MAKKTNRNFITICLVALHFKKKKNTFNVSSRCINIHMWMWNWQQSAERNVILKRIGQRPSCARRSSETRRFDDADANVGLCTPSRRRRFRWRRRLTARVGSWYVDGLSVEFYPAGDYPRFIAGQFSRVVKRDCKGEGTKYRIKYCSKKLQFLRSNRFKKEITSKFLFSFAQFVKNIYFFFIRTFVVINPIIDVHMHAWINAKLFLSRFFFLVSIFK